MKKIKIILILILFVICAFVLSACSGNLEDFYIYKANELTLFVGDEYNLGNDFYVSSDNQIFSIEGSVGKANNIGKVEVRNINSNSLVLIVNIEEIRPNISISGKNILALNEIVNLEVIVTPNNNYNLVYSVSDEDVLSVSKDGVVTAVGLGYASVRVSIEGTNYHNDYAMIVQDSDEISYDPIIETYIVNSDPIIIDTTQYKALFNPIIKSVSNAIVGLERFDMNNLGHEVMTDFGSATIYRRDAVLKDGSVIKNVGDEIIENVDAFLYYAISTRYLTKEASSILVYLGKEIGTVSASLKEYDDKIDLSVITFYSKRMLPTVRFADSDTLKQGEFVISIGNTYDIEYCDTSNVGVVSGVNRYVSTDTDGDDISDWDSEYIQHDAAINSADSGGGLFNIKGELIGINDTKISTNTFNCMSFAIPANLVRSIISMLEEGNKPNRPILGVSIVDVKNYRQAPAYYLARYPSMASIPDEIEYGFYVIEVNEGGVGAMANIQIGDVILEFNGVTTKYSYMLRAELSKFIYGSGEVAEIKVWRNGHIVSLYATF